MAKMRGMPNKVRGYLYVLVEKMAAPQNVDPLHT